MDQTRFKAIQSGEEVVQQLYLPAADRLVRDHSFTLSLAVPIPPRGRGDETLPLDIIVDRVDPAHQPNHVLSNGDTIIETAARIQPDGESFRISVVLCIGAPRGKDVCVMVAPDMERIILEKFGDDADREVQDLRLFEL